VIARHLLLLAIACDWELPVRQRAAVWLEVYGNSSVQSRTARYVSQKRLALIDLLCNQAGPPPLGSLVDFESLRFKARDELEYIFKSWADDVPFDVETLRDYRCVRPYARPGSA
jgi:hypothetical protein